MSLQKLMYEIMEHDNAEAWLIKDNGEALTTAIECSNLLKSIIDGIELKGPPTDYYPHSIPRVPTEQSIQLKEVMVLLRKVKKFLYSQTEEVAA